VLTYNSEEFLERCLKSLEGFDEILISDGGSTDATLAIAHRYGCTVIPQSNPGHPIADFSLERNRLLDAARNDWFFYLDSDEYLSKELKEEIRVACEAGCDGPQIYRVPWSIVSKDGDVVYSSFKTYYQHRFFNRATGARFERPVHERLAFDAVNAAVGTFSGRWYVPLDTQLEFKSYKEKLDRRSHIMIAQRPPTTFLRYLKRVTWDPARNIGKQIIKFLYLRARYSSRELPPARYELFKLYGQYAFAREATRFYARILRGKLKTASYVFAYTLYRLDFSPRRPKEIIVLMYHAISESGGTLSVPPETFIRQMEYLARAKQVVPLEDIVAFASGTKDLKSGSVAITFDDGYCDIAEVVEPILAKYGFRATVFVPSDDDAVTNPEHDSRMSWNQIRDLAGRTALSFEAHGRSHRALPQLTPSEAEEDLRACRDDFLKEVGREPVHLAYPYGAKDQAVMDMARKAGFKAAFGITEDVVRQDTGLYGLPRVQVDRTMTDLLFRLRLTGAVFIHPRMMALLRKLGR
jgi:peptidoglycan/xylan/chitin deacetylase (PgdA/CDA1 family)/glycosyltransferase involved in cell wall biosynthesis